MTPRQIAIAGAAAVLAATGIGFTVGRMTAKAPPSANAEPGRKVLYWYDPMYPAQHFDRPGKSPYMDMQLTPRYAGEAAGEATVRIDPARTASLGIRLATVERGALPSGATVSGVIDFNDRQVAVVQAKAAGFVQKVYGRAPGDVVAAGAPLADLLVPDWAGAQGEFLAVLRSGDAALIAAARQHLRLLDMPPGLIASVERSGRVHNVVAVTTPIGGVIKTLGVRAGMSVTAGQTLAEVNGLSVVWVDAAVPEALAAEVRPGAPATVAVSGFPGQTFSGRVSAVLPQAHVESRTLVARVELPNPQGRLRPGMFATVQLGGAPQPALLVPSEAVIRTGRRTLVMLARPGGGYQPVEVQVGREAAGRTEVLAGLGEGDKVVASGQFLLDSEASLSGLQPRPLGSSPAAPPAATPTLYETVGRVEQVSATSITLSHQPVPAIGWPAMTMTFRLADPALAQGIKPGDRVRFAFDHPTDGPTVRRLTRVAQP